MAGTIPANGAENLTPGMEEMGWAVLGTASLWPHPSLQLRSPPKTNELEEAFPLPKAHTREVALHSRGQELKSEEERKTDRKIHLPLENPQGGGHLEVIFHCAESCFWPFSRHSSLLKHHSLERGKHFPSILMGSGKGTLSWVQDLPPRPRFGLCYKVEPMAHEKLLCSSACKHFKCIRAEMQKGMSGLDLQELTHSLRGMAFKGENPCSKRKEKFSMVKGNLNKIPFWKEFKKIIFPLYFCLSSSGL